MSNEKFAEMTEKTEGTKTSGQDTLLSTHEYPVSNMDIKAIREKVGLSHGNVKEGQVAHEFVQTGTDIKAIREKIGLSQREFAALLCISKRTLEGWEQGHRTLNGPARALLTIFKNDPDSAIKALHGTR